MSLTRSSRTRRRAAWLAATAVLVVVAFGATAAAASAAGSVNIVRQAGPPPGTVPKGTHYFSKIQPAVEASTKGDWVLIEPGIYYESVKVTKAQSGISIRGVNRNTVIIDGQNEPGNGIEVFKTSNVWVENLTVRNFDTGCDHCGNEIWWNGGADSNEIGATGWYGSYLTAYDTGLNGGYGIFTGNEEKGSWEHIYASGFNDSGMYIGACRECNATVSDAVMENNSLGYSGSNSSGRLVIENSVFNHNLTGIAPNSENPGDGPPPLDGACDSFKNTSPTPTIESTKVKRCEIIRNNRVEYNDNTTVPVNGSTEIAPWGVGIELPGTYAVQVEGNVVTNNPNNGVLGFEYPNPFPLKKDTIFFQSSGNKINNNTFAGNGNNPGLEEPLKSFNGDLALLSNFAELFPGGPVSNSVNNCASGNAFSGTTFPPDVEGTWGCQNKTTPNPGGGEGAAGYLLTLQGQIEFLRSINPPVAQPEPPAQQTMPNPCEGVPKNPLCPKGNVG